MNWYKTAKSDLEFNFSEETNTIWKNLLKAEKEYTNISFDLENNDSVGDIRHIPLPDVKNKTFAEDKISIYAQMCNAGGDWETNSLNFFM